jgi:hypothetical protein
MKTRSASRATLALAFASVLILPEVAEAACSGMCVSCATPVLALNVAPASPTEGSVAAVACSATGGKVSSLVVNVAGGAFASGLQSETIVGTTASLQWTAPVAGSYAVTCTPTVETITVMVAGGGA